MRTIRVAITGLGAVGLRLARLLLARKSLYRGLYNIDVRLVAICSSSKGIYHETGLSEADLDNSAGLKHGASGPQWLEMEVGIPDVLFECGPSDFDRTPAPSSLPYYRLMLGAGRAIIAVSKSALVSHGPELIKLSKQQCGWIGLSGAAGAALPGLDLLHNSVLGCDVDKIEACLNATSNYILDNLVHDSATYEDPLSSESQDTTLAAAVELAQSQGFAERDASRDIGGWDSMAKLILLINFGILPNSQDDPPTEEDIPAKSEWIGVEHVERTGLSNLNVTRETVHQWKQTSTTPRLVSTYERIRSKRASDSTGSSDATSKRWRASVSLQLYPPSHPFASLRGTLKGIVISTEEMGDVFASACGLEPDATAASALKDFQSWLRSS